MRGAASLCPGTGGGPWLHRLASGALVMLWSRDGGHGMIVRTLDGRLLVTLHQPNQTPLERSVFAEIEETPTTVRLARHPDRRGAAAHL